MPVRPPRFIRRLVALFTWSARDREMEREMSVSHRVDDRGLRPCRNDRGRCAAGGPARDSAGCSN